MSPKARKAVAAVAEAHARKPFGCWDTDWPTKLWRRREGEGTPISTVFPWQDVVCVCVFPLSAGLPHPCKKDQKEKCVWDEMVCYVTKRIDAYSLAGEKYTCTISFLYMLTQQYYRIQSFYFWKKALGRSNCFFFLINFCFHHELGCTFHPTLNYRTWRSYENLI
jgi:hypothetical protein